MTFCSSRAAAIDLDDQSLLRYSRHILLDELGIEGQQRISNAHALIIGAGGLGSPAALYLASAGVGTLTIVDDDTVDLTNLQRQIVHNEARVGLNKAESARQTLAALNPHITINALTRRATPAELGELIASADVVLDCCDNFSTRHAVNRACVAAGVPLVSGAAVRFDGQLSVFDTRQSDAPCYHCLFDEDGDDSDSPCATFGVFAPLVGIIGAMQAAEALKLLSGCGTPLTRQLQVLDARSMQWKSIRTARDPHCPVCATRGQTSSQT